MFELIDKMISHIANHYLLINETFAQNRYVFRSSYSIDK